MGLRPHFMNRSLTMQTPVSLSPGQYQEAQRVFQRSLGRGDFTAATVALLQALSRSTSVNRRPASLLWWGAMLLDFVLVCTLFVLLLLPNKDRQGGATCE